MPEAETPYPGDLVEHLRGLVTLARSLDADPRGAFESAAFALRVDVSVLRRRIKTLTRHVGARLVEGRGARLRLSAAGEAAVERAHRVLAEAEALRQIGQELSRRLRIGCTGTITTEVLPPALVQLRRRWPGLSVSIRRAGARLSRQLLEQGEIDLAVVRGEVAPKGFDSQRLMRDTVWLATPEEHPLARTRRVSLAALAREPIISFRPGSFTRRRVMKVLSPLGATVQVELDGKVPALRYVELGLGIAFLSLVPTHELTRPGIALRDVTRQFPPAAFWVIWRRDRDLNVVERELLKALS